MQVNTTFPPFLDPVQSIQPTANHREQKKVEQVERSSIELQKSKIEKSSFWQQHKVKILVAASVLTIYSIAKWYDKTYWIYGYDGGKCPAPDPSDKFNHYYCENSEWRGIGAIPLPGFCDRAKACSLGEKITGCVDGKYFHHLSKECSNNPKGFVCEKTISYGFPSEDCQEDK